MKASSLFVLGLAIGGLTVFGVRAVSLEDDDTATQHEAPNPEAPPAGDDAHPGHTDTTEDPEEPGEATPAEESGDLADKQPENTICPVMGNPVDPEIYVDYEGRRIGFCCPGCDRVFLEDPEKYLKKLDADLAGRGAEEAEPDPGTAEEPLDEDRPPENEICPVMGNPVDPEIWVDHEGRRIGFCSPGCDRVFLEDPAKYMQKVDAELRRRAEK